MKKRRIEIRDLKTNEVVKTVETEFRGHNYDKLISGLFRKMDADRFYIHQEDED